MVSYRTQTDSNKFFWVSRLGRNFLGGLAAIFLRLSLGLAAIFDPFLRPLAENFQGHSVHYHLRH